MGLELCEGHFDRIEVWAVRRQEEKPSAALLEDGLAFALLWLVRLPMIDAAKILGEALGDAEQLVLRRLAEHGIEVPHLVIAAMPDSQIIPRSNFRSDALRSFAEVLADVAYELAEPPNRTT